jgi:adenylate kinase
MSNKGAIFVLGPPGSGKGTQARLLAQKTGFFHFITSKVGLDYIASHSDAETRRQKELYNKGILYEPKWLVLRVLKEKTREVLENYPGIVYDGSPRTFYEAKELLAFLKSLVGKDNILTLEILVSEGELKNRLEKRLICDKNASHVFIRSTKLRPGARCPEKECGGFLKERELDKVFETRIKEFRERTMPAVNYLKKFSRVIPINGEQSIEAVHKEIMEKVEL